MDEHYVVKINITRVDKEGHEVTTGSVTRREKTIVDRTVDEVTNVVTKAPTLERAGYKAKAILDLEVEVADIPAL